MNIPAAFAFFTCTWNIHFAFAFALAFAFAFASLARVDDGVCADSNPPFGQMYILICTKITLLDFDLLFTDGGCTTPFMSFYGLLHYGFSWRPKMSHSVAAKLLRHAELRVGGASTAAQC